MANTIRLKKRAASGSAGAPTTLAPSEVAFNEADKKLYYGFGDDDFQLGGTTVETDTDLTTIRAGLTYRF